MFNLDFNCFKRGSYRSFLAKGLHLFNNPGKEELKRITDSFDCLTNTLGGDVFLSDAMLLWGREIGWMDDIDFIAALKDTEPQKDELKICWRTHVLCWAARQSFNVKGDYFEFGCYKGFSGSVVAHYCKNIFLESSNRKYHWFDLFSSNKKENIFIMDQSKSEEIAGKRAALLPQVNVRKGDVLSTYLGNEEYDDIKIAFAHFDLNDYETESIILDTVMKRVNKGSVLLFDDFGMAPFKRQNKNYRKYFSDIGLPILELPTGQGLVIIQ